MNGTRATITNLPYKSQYSFIVRAVNEVGTALSPRVSVANSYSYRNAYGHTNQYRYAHTYADGRWVSIARPFRGRSILEFGLAGNSKKQASGQELEGSWAFRVRGLYSAVPDLRYV